MISVLIPVYNYNIVPLVENLHQQLTETGIIFEILAHDDGSTNQAFIESNQSINNLEYTSYHILNKNIGRSAVRNLLAKNASFEWLLFLDADVLPKNRNFISKYLRSISTNSEVIYGGIVYTEEKPDQTNLLRWVYGNKREALTSEERKKNTYVTFLTLNFLIHKSVFSKVSFNENIPNLRHEDTLFSYNSKLKNINVEHIENPTYHLGLEDSNQFFKKSMESVDVLFLLLKQGLIPGDYTKISRNFFKLKRLGFHYVLAIIYKLFRSHFKRNLLSNKPSLFIFDLCRLGYLCTLYIQ
ncbi:glycosyltransferase family 2 protein [Gelidibacter sp. F63206]|uniref:glycosyltransferase family 2 protein n=1 Tax=Gelidibacter sp. F63206 TaxID=2926425 RepID=UPI001FF6C611|nr:glycosyltransferase family 2 protein [Gelidibacter sp. F63206]MCK0114774.1 glycosyltransferase family 2 protein [Gelidibacter sp. F63206]